MVLGFKRRKVHKLKQKQKTLIMLKSEVAVPLLTACRGRHGLMNSSLVEGQGCSGLPENSKLENSVGSKLVEERPWELRWPLLLPQPGVGPVMS